MRNSEYLNRDQEITEHESPFKDGKLRETLLWYLDKNTNLARQEDLFDLSHPEDTYSLNQLIEKTQQDSTLLEEINHFLKLLIGKASQVGSHSRQELPDIDALYKLLNPDARQALSEQIKIENGFGNISEIEIDKALGEIEAKSSLQSHPTLEGKKDIDEEALEAFERKVIRPEDKN